MNLNLTTCESAYSEALKGEEVFGIPEVIPELSGMRVLTTELISGIPIDQAEKQLTQDERNFVSALPPFYFYFMLYFCFILSFFDIIKLFKLLYLYLGFL